MPANDNVLIDVDQREAAIRRRVYDEAHFWADVPADWVCPMCGTPKKDFDMIEL